MTETQAPTTKEKPTFTQTLRCAVDRYPEFLTLGDPELELVAVESYRFSQELKDGRNPRWLSLIGSSGTGKTFMAEKLYREARRHDHLRQHRVLINPVLKVFWPDLLSSLRDQKTLLDGSKEDNFHLLRDLADANFVFIDELAIDHDPSGFAKDKLCELLSRRVGKWTLLTSNLTLPKLAQMDARISSRMIRGQSVVVEINTRDFNLRTQQETNQ